MAYTVYANQNNLNVNKLAIAAEYVGADFKEVEGFELGKDNQSEEFLAKFPMGRVPAMDTPDGPLFESNAMMRYIIRSADDQCGLLGNNAYEASCVDMWLDVLNGDLWIKGAPLVRMLMKLDKYNGLLYNMSREAIYKVMDALEQHLILNTYLVGHQITAADIGFVCVLTGLFKLILGPEFRDEHPHLERYFLTCRNQPQFAVLGEIEFCEAEMQPEKPKKGKKKNKGGNQGKQKQKKKKEEKPEEKKPVNPLDMLPPSVSGKSMDDLKRLLSNGGLTEKGAYAEKSTNGEEFWSSFDAEGYSIYIGKFKYPEDNEVLFMTCNLASGYIQRLDRVRKYGYGCFAIVDTKIDAEVKEGEATKTVQVDRFDILSVWIFRGTEIPEEMKDSVGFDSYDFEKLDPTKNADRATFDMIWEGNSYGEIRNINVDDIYTVNGLNKNLKVDEEKDIDGVAAINENVDDNGEENVDGEERTNIDDVIDYIKSKNSEINWERVQERRYFK